MQKHCIIALIALALPGCQTTPDVADESGEAAPPTATETAHASSAPAVSTESFDRVFLASVDVLRDWRFVVNRKDRRQGIVSTSPRVASSVVEPWQPDATRSDRTWESTLNYQRRRIRIEIAPTDPATVVESSGQPVSAYQLNVICEFDRRYYPPQQLTTAAVTKIRFTNSRSVRKPIRTETGLEEAYWAPAGRDHAFERELANAIIERASIVTPAPVVSNTPESGPE